MHAATHITFHMARNRYCHHIGRQHRSNNVNWLVDLVYGVCVQTCQDDACRGFRSEPFALPDVVLAALKHSRCSAAAESADRGTGAPPP